MKKNVAQPGPKLKLNRETLRLLEEPRLGEAVGGDTEDPSVTVRYSNCGSCNTGP
jgi:hypothetical protein